MSVTSSASDQLQDMDRAAGAYAQPCPAVTLEIGVFFDGTGNNAANVRGPSSSYSDSYNSSLTNVKLLHDLYLVQQDYWPRNSCGYAIKRDAIYQEGIGTTAGEPDWWPNNKIGAAVGMGPTGVESRVFEACILVGKKINDLSPGIEPTEVVLDVFGFSRGAAAARYFVNCFRQGFIRYDALDYTLHWPWVHIDYKRAYLPEGRNVRIRFIGVFDTVAAIGLGTNDDNGDVNVHMSTVQADGIMHLIAENEYRENFRLNHNSPGGGPFRSCTGAHSDIGGGYAGKGSEALVEKANTKTFWSREAAEAARAEDAAHAARQRASMTSFYVKEGWLRPGDPDGGLKNEPGPIFEVPLVGPLGWALKLYAYTTAARLERDWVELGLSRIPLAMMHDAAKAAGVPLDSLPLEEENYKIPEDLSDLARIMRNGGTPDKATQRAALFRYGHMSSNFEKIGMSPEPGFKRSVDWNIAEKAK
jgi:cold shock CspA family protein